MPSPHSRSTLFRTAALAAGLPMLVLLGACTADPAAKIATATDAVTHEENDRVPDGASWTQHYFPSSDGSDVELHADALLPENLGEGETVPVILSVGSYFGHFGELAPEEWEHAGPSDRFGDLIDGGDLFEEGYAFVMVDLRGFGGSTGCLDFMGPGEQADVAAAIDWAASQPWSTGDVGMYGKSYDATAGLVGNNLDHDALKAVIAQEPIWDPFTSVRSNGVPRSPIVDASRTYNEIAAIPGMPDDDERYQANAAYEVEHPECAAVNTFNYRMADPESEHWTTRDLAQQAAGTDTPLFITQGFLENTTPAEEIDTFLDNHEGPQRGWLGQWDHVRGNEEVDGVLKMGREGWFDETMSFFDEHLKGVEPSIEYPSFAIQDSTGAWRAEQSWSAPDSTVTIEVGAGSYLDDGAEGDPEIETGNSFFLWSEPIGQPTRITGTPEVALDAAGVGNVMVKLHDVAPDGTAVMFDEHVAVVQPGSTSFDLKSTDWTLASGHVLAVEVGTIESGALSNWIDTPSNQEIKVSATRLTLALDDPADDVALDGDPAVYMETYSEISTRELAAGTPTFTVPVAKP